MSQNQNLLTAAQNMGMLQIIHVGDKKPANTEIDDFTSFFAADAPKPAAATVKAEPQAKKEPKSDNPNDAYEVGDVLYTSWGYEQTNIDFYQVVSKHGKSTLGIRKIAGSREYNSEWMTGKTTPIIDAFEGELMKVRINKYGTARVQGRYGLYPLEYTMVDGKRVYGSKGYSCYA